MRHPYLWVMEGEVSRKVSTRDDVEPKLPHEEHQECRRCCWEINVFKDVAKYHAQCPDTLSSLTWYYSTTLSKRTREGP